MYMKETACRMHSYRLLQTNVLLMICPVKVQNLVSVMSTTTCLALEPGDIKLIDDPKRPHCAML